MNNAIFTRTRWGLPLLALICAWSMSAQAEQSVTASLDETTMAVGESVDLTVVIRADGRVTVPREINVEGLQLQYARQSQNTQIINGKYSSSMSLVYLVTAEKPGTYTIPAIQVQAGGQVLQTQPIALKVEPAGAAKTPGPAANDARIFAEIKLSKTTAYVGEMIPAELRLYVESQTPCRLEKPPVFQGEGFTTQKMPEPSQKFLQIAGKSYDVMVFRTAITPGRAGKIAIGPGEIGVQAQIRRRPGSGSPIDDIFGGGLFSQTELKHLKIVAPAMELDVKPLPAAGRPKGFSGAVGSFKFSGEGTPSKVKVGDPVTMKLIISGRGNFDRINAPALTQPGGWHTYPASADFKESDELGISGSKTFEMAVIPEEKKTAMPSFSFSFFDPASGKYQTLVNEAAPLEVEGGQAGTAVVAAPAPGSKEAPQATPAPTPKPATADILGLRYDSGPQRTAFEPLYKQRTFLLAQAIPAAALAIFLGLRLRRSSATDARLAKLRSEKAQLRSRLSGEESPAAFFETTARIVQIQTALLTGREPRSIDAAEVKACWNLNESESATLEEVFDACAELLYSGTGTKSARLPESDRQRVLVLLNRLESPHANN